MKLIELKCKNCGAILEVEKDEKNITCQYCKAKFKFDDEVQHIKYDDMEQAGYEFEKGRIKAQNENKKVIIQIKPKSKEINPWVILAWIFFFPFMLVYYILKNDNISKENKKKIFWILGWVFFFPAPLSIVIWKSKFSKNIRILLLIVLWGGLIILGNILPNETTEQVPTNNTEVIEESTTKEEEKVEEDDKEEKVETETEKADNSIKSKTYKIDTKEYREYVYSVIENIVKKNNTYTSFKMNTYASIYLKVNLYPNKRLSKDEFEKQLNELSIEIFKELKKNKYKKGGFFASNYEIINVNFYNYDEHYPNNLNIERTQQYYVLELKDYDTFDKYDSRNDY